MKDVPTNQGLSEGEACNRLIFGIICEGTIERKQVEDCYCHLTPPCGKCIDPSLEYCPECDWDGSME